MLSFTILPSLGIKNDVPPDDQGMFEFITDSIAKTHCADSEYVSNGNSYVGRQGTATKTGGRTLFLSTDASVTSGTMSAIGLFQYHQLGSWGDQNYLAVTNKSDEGKLYTWTSGGSATVLSAGTGDTNLLFGGIYTYCNFLQASSFVIITDGIGIGGATPYCHLPGNTVMSKLIKSGTQEYGFMFLEYFKNRIFGANCLTGFGSGYSVRWSNLNPTFPILSSTVASTVEFESDANLFYPQNQLITGIKVLNRGRLFVYAENSIAEIKHTGNFAAPVSISEAIYGFGTIAHDSIVESGGAHFFYDGAHGFCVFNGYDVKIISNKIQETIDTISPIVMIPVSSFGKTYTMQGCHIDSTNEIAWTCSTNGTTNTFILYYNYITGNWRKDTLSARCITSGRKLNADTKNILFLANSGDVYHHGLNVSDDGASYGAYRVEPVLNFGGNKKSLLLEVWFNSSRNISVGTLDVYYRGSDTLGKLETLSWSTLGTLNLSSPTAAVVRPLNGVNVNNRYHQIKWGTDASSDLFSIREIKFNYVAEGPY